METITTARKMQMIADLLRLKNITVGFIPTMGALHAGHLQLVKESKKNNDVTIVSIFVNPKQFGPNEDLAKYPRPIKQDRKLLMKEAVDYLFYPNVEQMYPEGFKSSVTFNKLVNIFEGKSRPGHFDGMATVVLKLFNIISPTNVYFGQKDFQQCTVVRQMINDFNLQISFNMLPTVRDPDGLALSSRNIFLSTEERAAALNLNQALLLGKKLISNGDRNTDLIKSKMKVFLKKNKLINLDYVDIADPGNLSVAKRLDLPAVILIAAFVGKTRLIDNITIK